MYSLTALTTKIKRRLRQVRPTTGAGTEEESGYLVSNDMIYDAINMGRQKIIEAVKNSMIWASQMCVMQTVEDVQDYSLDTSVHNILSVLFNTNSSGKRTSSSIIVYKINDMFDEETVILDPMYTPSDTEPYFRLINRGIRLITSTDGSVTKDLYARIEFLGDMDKLKIGDDSYLTDELDFLVMDWALKILTEKTDPNFSIRMEKSFYNGIQIINARQ